MTIAAFARQQGESDLGAQIREQVRQQIQEAQQQAREAQQQAREAQRAAQEAAGQNPGEAVVLVPPVPPTAPPAQFDVMPAQVFDIVIFFFVTVAVIIIGLPIARALGRRIDRKPYKQSLDPELASQLRRIENTVDSMAIEIERISEAQRYMARLQTERAEPASLPPTDGR